MVDGTTFTGYGPELMSKIAEKAGFEYELSVLPEGKYGQIVDGKPNGLVGEVYEKVSFTVNFFCF